LLVFHRNPLDRDAIDSIQTYLDYRFKKTEKPMNVGEPLFLNVKNEPITPSWVRRSFSKLANSAGIQRKLRGYNLRTRYEKDSHELRDLLKSTLIDCGARYDVADHVIGHMPKDSYEKQAILYPESMRNEFMKASAKLNIFSNISKWMKGDQNQAFIRDVEKRIEEAFREKEEEFAEIRRKTKSEKRKLHR